MLNLGQFLGNLLCGQKLLLRLNTLLFRVNEEEEEGREAKEADCKLLLRTGAMEGG